MADFGQQHAEMCGGGLLAVGLRHMFTCVNEATISIRACCALDSTLASRRRCALDVAMDGDGPRV